MSLSAKAENALEDAQTQIGMVTDQGDRAAELYIGIAMGYALLKIAEELRLLAETHAMANGMVTPRRD